MDLYQRNINVSVHRMDDDQIMLWSTMLDLDHSIRVQLIIDAANRQIVDASGEMLKVPFSRSRFARVCWQMLKGTLSISPLASTICLFAASMINCTRML